MIIGNTSFFDLTNCEWSQLAENGCQGYLTNSFHTLLYTVGKVQNMFFSDTLFFA